MKELSQEHLDILTENSTIHESIDMAQTDEIVSAVAVQKYKDSLAYQICDVQPIHGPTGAVFALKWDGTKTFLKRNNVTVEDDAVYNTGFTLEAIQDIQAQFGKNAVDFVSRVFAGISNTNENTKLLQKMDAIAKNTGVLTLTDAGNAETTFFEVAKRVSESILGINTTATYRSMDAFVVLPISVASALLGLGVYFNADEDKEAGLFLGRVRRTKYYVNPDVNSTTCYVGVNPQTPGGSSLVFSPYQHTIMSAVDPDTAQVNLFVVNRYAITQNANDTVGNEMLHKFDIA